MVEIEEIQEVEPESTATDAEGPTNPEDEWEKLMGEDLVMKIIDKSEPPGGKGPQAIQPQDAVLVDIIGRVATDRSMIDGPIIQQATSWLVVVGEGDVMPCLEMAIRFMETGQTSIVWAHSKYAFGPGTRNFTVQGETQQLPPHSNVLYEIKVAMLVVDTSRLNPYFTIQKATTRKAIANDIYQHEWCPPPKSIEDPSCEMAMTRTIRLYTRAAKDMETLLNGTYFAQVEADHPQRHQTRQLMMDCLNNIVAVHLRQHQYHTAKQAAVEVLKHDPKNIKALLRAAKAALLDPASTLEEVQAALKAAEGEITYKNPQEEKQLKQLKVQFKQKKHEYKEQTKAMFGDKLKQSNAFGSVEEPHSQEEDTTSKSDNNDTTKEEAETEQAGETVASELKPTLKQRVSFDEATTKPPSKEGIKTDDEAIKDDFNYWKIQGMTLLVQVILPLALYFLYRMFTKAHNIGEATLSAYEARMPQVEDPDVINLDNEGGNA